MKKKKLLQQSGYIVQSLNNLQGLEDYQLEDYYEDIQNLAACLRTFKYYNIESDFYRGLRQLLRER